ncbi:hypothetical protein V8C34DRAFT_44195 [Trichoderma compactum]
MTSSLPPSPQLNKDHRGPCRCQGTAKGPVKETAPPRELQVFDQPPAGRAGSWPVSIVLVFCLLYLIRFDLISVWLLSLALFPWVGSTYMFINQHGLYPSRDPRRCLLPRWELLFPFSRLSSLSTLLQHHPTGPKAIALALTSIFAASRLHSFSP